MAEIDEKYDRGMIYTIRNIKDDTLIYIGSTINNLSKRLYQHKVDCKAGKNVSLYSYIENNDWTDWYIELCEAYPCHNKKELDRREGQVTREIGTINKCIAGRTMKEYYEDNTEYFKEIHKKYYENNAEKLKENKKIYREKNAEKLKEKRKEKVCCNMCGDFIGKHYLKHHQKTKSCMSKIPNNTDIPSDTHI